VSDPVQNLLEILGPHINPPVDRVHERIILSAKKRFLEEGFAKVTIEDLCHSLRISKKTFYKYFKDKEDLVIAIAAHNATLLLPKIAAIHAGNLTPDERFDRFVDFFFNTLAKNMSVAFLADLQALIPSLWEAIDAFRMVQVGNIMQIFKEGQEAGIYRRDIDPEKFSRILYLIVSRVVDPKTLYEHGLQLQDIPGLIFKIVRYGVYERPGKRKGAK